MAAQYQPNKHDESILYDITTHVRESLGEWYGGGSRLESHTPEIRSYRNSFILRYPIETPSLQEKNVLVKIRRNPKMQSLSQAVSADIHRNVPGEYLSLVSVFQHMGQMEEDFDAIRPLSYIERYSAIVMEEYPSSTLRHLLNRQRSAKTDTSLGELKDAARKTGKWLYYFQHRMHTPAERPYTAADILLEVGDYAERIESYSRGRVQARPIVEAFSKKLSNLPLDRVAFSQSHADMTSDNVLYSKDQKICIIDIKKRLAPIYADLGLILIHPDTTKQQILTGGRYYPESVLRQYQSEIIGGYFDQAPGNEVLARIYSAVKILDKWLMYEELMSRYKGAKHVLSIAAAPFISAYFHSRMNKYLNRISDGDFDLSHRREKLASGISS